MTSSVISPNFSDRSPFLEQQWDNCSPRCALKWRQGQLLVNLAENAKNACPESFNDERSLVECLKGSSARLVRIDPNLGEARLKIWANACQETKKPIFLQLPFTQELPMRRNPLSWGLKRLFDWSAAALLLAVLSPLMLALALAIRILTPGPILFCQWRVGKRGKLFRIFKFRTMVVDAEEFHHQVMANQTGLHKCKDDSRITPLGRWMRKYSLDELPQLFNVLRGEMSLVGPRPWALYDAVRINKAGQKRLNALPGITGDWQVKARSNLLDLEAVNHCDLEYLRSWSLWRDLLILPLTMLRVISGFGAY